MASYVFGNALGASLAKDNYSGNGQQGAPLTFAQDVAQRTAANPLLAFSGDSSSSDTDLESFHNQEMTRIMGQAGDTLSNGVQPSAMVPSTVYRPTIWAV